jgi:hypothetical protein
MNQIGGNMTRFAGKYGVRRAKAGASSAEVAYLHGHRKAWKKVKEPINTNSDCIVTKAADPEKVKAYHESEDYKQQQIRLERMSWNKSRFNY